MYVVTREEFEQLVSNALDELPDTFADELKNVAILVDDIHPENSHLLGLYHGVALPKRTFDHSGYPPDTISIYQLPIQWIVNSAEELAHQVKVTVFHEVGHYFGMSEAELHALGWG